VVGGETTDRCPAQTEIIDTLLWGRAEIIEQGNIPFGLSKFALVQVDEGIAIVFGGRGGAAQDPLAVAYRLEMFDPAFPPARRQLSKSVVPGIRAQAALPAANRGRPRGTAVAKGEWEKWVKVRDADPELQASAATAARQEPAAEPGL
jgi:hypothetical protein